MRGRVDTILMCVKFSDNAISSLNFSYIGGVPLNKMGLQSTPRMLLYRVGNDLIPPPPPRPQSKLQQPKKIYKYVLKYDQCWTVSNILRLQTFILL